MDRRQMLLGLAGIGSAIGSGCANSRYSHLLKPGTPDMLGSHDAGAGVWYPLVDESVAKLLSRCPPGVQQVGFGGQALVDSQGAAIAPEAGSGLATGTSGVVKVGLGSDSGPVSDAFDAVTVHE